MFNVDSLGNVYFPAGVSVANYPITLNTPTHVLVAGVGGRISKVATSQLISNTDVTSVFGRTGDIIALPGDYTSEMIKEVNNLYFTIDRARSAISLTALGTSGPATYNPATGVINVPQYQNEFNGVTTFNGRPGDVVLTALDVTTALTYTPLASETDPIWTAEKPLYYTKVETQTYVTTQISNLIDSAPTTLDTLNELAAALGDDANFSTTITTLIGTKEPAIEPGTTAQYWRGDKTWQTLPIYSLPIASATVLGGIKVGSNLSINATTGVLDATFTYTLPTASTTILGGIKVGANLSIDGNGVLSAGNSYVLPTASAIVLGGIKVGTNLSIDANGVLSSTDTNTTYENFTRTVSGLVPHPGGATTNRYLREDGTWVIPPDTDTVYVHPTTAGNKHIPAGGSTGQILRYSSDGTAVWGADNDTTYSVFTRTTNGLTPAAPAGTGTTRYLREDGTWVVPPDNDTTYTLADLGGQPQLDGTGFVKANGTTISYDNSTYLTTATAASTYLPLAGGTMTGVITTPNGTFGIIVGDDSRLADRNVANTLFLEGNQNNDRGYINFSQTTGNALGAVNGGDLTWRGNVVLHAANYNSYAPSLSGSGATGSWGISITGTAGSETLSTVTSRGSVTSTTITASSFFELSDIRLKTLLEDKLDYYAISNVSTKYYEKNGKTELGYFAQDFEEILPSAVSKDSDGLLNLSYREVHTAKIAYLEEKIKQLENELGRISK